MKPGARCESIELRSDGVVVVKVRQAAVEGKANAALVQLLARRLQVARSSVVIVRGFASRVKVVSFPFASRARVLDALAVSAPQQL